MPEIEQNGEVPVPMVEEPRREPEPTNEGVATAMTMMTTTTNAGDLPFLVTHWLAHYQDAAGPAEGRTAEEIAAMRQIRRAASELSTAFHALGSFGATTRVSTIRRWVWLNEK